ncbi:Proline racemase [Marinibacterium anthonyi]|nr:Proline racemase [Marinibacterium anthonyi]
MNGSRFLPSALATLFLSSTCLADDIPHRVMLDEYTKFTQADRRDRTNHVADIWVAIQSLDIASLTKLIDQGLTSEELTHGLIAASNSKSVETLSMLISAGADVSSEEGIALTTASASDCYGCVRVLLEAGADVRASNDEALFTAAHFGRYHVAELLLKAGANPSARGEGVIASEAHSRGFHSVADLIATHGRPANMLSVDR